MDEDLKTDIITQLYRLYSVTDNNLYDHYSPKGLKEELDEIEALIQRIEAL